GCRPPPPPPPHSTGTTPHAHRSHRRRILRPPHHRPAHPGVPRRPGRHVRQGVRGHARRRHDQPVPAPPGLPLPAVRVHDLPVDHGLRPFRPGVRHLPPPGDRQPLRDPPGRAGHRGPVP